ncbi:hypothetical protein VPH35_112385 [Triticum aestivum]
MAMRNIWALPDEEVLRYTGHDWFIVLLSQLNPVMRDQIIFLFWRTWHLRNDLIFGKGKESVSASACFVESYWESFGAHHSPRPVDFQNKGKGPLVRISGVPNSLDASSGWYPPPAGWFKINVDASFVESIREASVGVVVRDEEGEVIVSSWDFIGACQSVEEAELRACIAGLYIASLASGTMTGLLCRDLKMEAVSISKLINNLQWSKISRTANMVAHLIAKYSFDNRLDGILVNDVLPCVMNIVSNECTGVVG